jgi:hypothetical protein
MLLPNLFHLAVYLQISEKWDIKLALLLQIQYQEYPVDLAL